MVKQFPCWRGHPPAELTVDGVEAGVVAVAFTPEPTIWYWALPSAWWQESMVCSHTVVDTVAAAARLKPLVADTSTATPMNNPIPAAARRRLARTVQRPIPPLPPLIAAQMLRHYAYGGPITWVNCTRVNYCRRQASTAISLQRLTGDVHRLGRDPALG